MPTASCRLVTALVLGVAAMVGCSARHSPSPEAVGERVASVGRLTVTVSEVVSAGRMARFEKVDGPARLTAAVESELARVGKLERESTRVLELVVTQYRLRSGASVFMWGMMAGGDSIAVDVVVREGERTLRTYSTGAGSVAAGGLDQASRFERLARAVGERVVMEL